MARYKEKRYYHLKLVIAPWYNQLGGPDRIRTDDYGIAVLGQTIGNAAIIDFGSFTDEIND